MFNLDTMNLLFLQDIDFPSCQNSTYGVLLEIRTVVRFFPRRIAMREFDEIMRLATAQSMPAAFISAVWAYAAKLQQDRDQNQAPAADPQAIVTP